MRMTLPQIILLNHAASVNYKRSEERRDLDRLKAEAAEQRDEDDPVVWRGKRLSELDSNDMAEYYGGFMA